jgi:xylan 1,4-beta-xylosidase
MAPFHIDVDCGRTLGPLRPVWRSFGYDELNWTYTPRGKACFGQIGDLARRAPYYIRCHHTLTSGNGLSWPTMGSGNVYHEDDKGKARYDFRILDQVLETILEAGCKPIVELGFMPAVLSGGPDPGMTYTYGGDERWRYPPRDHSRWQELVFQTVRHCVDVYGKPEVVSWYWEVWNEPDNTLFFQGTVKDYCRVYDHAAAGAALACPEIRIGGPAIGGRARFLDRFLKHCRSGKNAATGKRGSRLDFLSFHAKGTSWPEPGRQEQQPSLRAILRQVDAYERVLERYPDYARLPWLLDECDMAVATHLGVYDFPFYAFHNTAFFPVFLIRMAHALIDRMIVLNRDLVLFTTWAFYAEGKRFFEGNRTLFTGENIRKPVFNAFALMEMLGETRIHLKVKGGGEGGPDALPEVNGLATMSGEDAVQVLVWHFHEDQKQQAGAAVQLSIPNLPFSTQDVSVRHYRVDEKNNNTHTLWKGMGSPQNPTPEQIKSLQQAGELKESPLPEIIPFKDHTFRCNLTMPLPGVSLIVIEKE